MVPFLFAACGALDDDKIGFWDVAWSMVVLFFWFMFIWIFITLFADIFRRNDMSGASKAIWLVLLVVLPFLGSLIYILMRPKVTAQDIQQMTRAEAGMKAASQVSTADELTKLGQLKAAGAISAEEYEKLKAKIIA